LACDLAALLSERDLLRSHRDSPERPTSASDITDRLELLAIWRRTGRVPAGTDGSSLVTVDRASRHLAKNVAMPAAVFVPTDETVARLLLWAYPDRLARQREPGSDRYLLASGRGGILSRHATVRNAPYLIAVSLAAIPGQSDALIHQAHAISELQLRHDCAAQLRTVRAVSWDAAAERVVAAEEESLWGVRLASRPISAAPDELLQALLGWLKTVDLGTVLPWTPVARQFCMRVQLLQSLQPEQWPVFTDAGLLASLDDWLAPHLAGITSRSKLERINLLAALSGRLTWQQQRTLDEQAPLRLAVPSGSQLLLEYAADGPPVLAVKLQEMFGLGETPCVGWGKVPVLLHLLSPAGRPIQVTTDLRNFWDSVYPQVKKELKGRYPKHPWPDDPWNAVPTRKTNRALRK
jgi:ATP-dependent helicase HrpB